MTGTGRKHAFVAGGTSGIGRTIVEQLAASGMRVSFTGRNEARGAAVAASTGARFIAADATDRRACDAAVEAVFALCGGAPDLFVSCAAIVFESPLADTPEEIFSELIEVNLTSSFRYSRACFAAMKARGHGVIVHIVSDAALVGIHHLPAYSVSKAGLLAMSEALAAEAVMHGVRVNAICPGAVHPGVQSTPRGYGHHAEDDSNWAAAPSGRHGKGSDICEAVLWLASDKASHVAGATLRIDGGASAAMRGGARG
ncbi:MAG: SDR family NAD(P)-dependent oxidoreductase [Rhodobacteraceae bacterium]|nr:SDR family NAD(P)-dependent oxidoreductase [Paracoccaceae bacterium]